MNEVTDLIKRPHELSAFHIPEKVDISNRKPILTRFLTCCCLDFGLSSLRGYMK